MATNRAKALLREQNKRAAFPRAVDKILAALFPQQTKIVTSTAKRKAMHPGRRSGKTTGLSAVALWKASLFPGQTIPVFERTLTSSAAKTMWKSLVDCDTEFKLGIDFHHTYKIATCPNGAQIALLGADTQESADKHRGEKFPAVLVDEAGTYRSKILDYLLTDVAEPATIDYDGEIIVAGTPNIEHTGTWYDICHSPEWEVHHWDLRDNPTLGPKELDLAARRVWREEWLARIRKQHGWTETTARYLREYLGVWTPSNEDRMYAFERTVNLISALPSFGEWQYWLGLDLGYTDPTSFVVMAARRGDPYAYVVESYEQTGLIPSSVAAHVERLRNRYNFRAIVADTGGYGKAVVVEMVERYNLPIQAARKRDKRVYVEHMNGDFRSGRIQIVRDANRELCDDLAALPWNVGQTDAAKGYRDHLPDALLYVHRELRAWENGLGDADGPTPGSPEWYAAEAEALMVIQEEAYRRDHPEVEESWRERYVYGD